MLDLGTLVGYLKLDDNQFTGPAGRAMAKLGEFAPAFAKLGLVAGAGALAAGAALVKAGSVFDDVSDTIRAKTGLTGASLDSLVDSAKHVGTEVPASFGEIGPVIAELNRGLDLTGPRLEKLTGQFVEYARISKDSLDPAAVSATFKAYSVDGAQASKVLDQLFRISQDTGVPLSELISSAQSGGPAFRQFGLNIGEAASLIGNLKHEGLDAGTVVAGLNRAQVTFAKEGVPMRKGLEDTITQIKGYIKSGNTAAATQLAAKIFSARGAGKFVDAVKSGALSVDALSNVTTKSSDTIMKAGKDTADFAEQWQLFKNRALVAVEPLATKFFNAMGDGMAFINDTGVPALASLSDNAADVGHAFQSAERFISSNQTTFEVIAGVIATVLVPALIAMGVQATISAAKSVAAWVATQIGAAQSAAMQVLSLSLLTLGWIRSGVQATLSAARIAAAWLVSKLGVAGTIVLYGVAFAMMAAGWIASAAAATAGAIEMAAAWLIAMGPIAIVVAAIAGIVFLIVKHWDTIKAATVAAWHWIVDTISSAVSWVIGFVKNNWPLILAIITGPIGLAALFITKNMGTIKSTMSAAWNAILGAAKAVWKSVSGVITNGASAIVNGVKAIPGKLRALASSFGAAGKALITAFVNGLKNAGGIISGIAGNVWTAVKSLLNSAIGKVNAALNFTIGLPGPDLHINAGHIPRLAKGGIVDRPTLLIAGEAGPEAIVPLSGTNAKAHGLFNDAPVTVVKQKQDAMGMELTQNIYPQPGQSEKQIADAAASRLMFVMNR